MIALKREGDVFQLTMNAGENRWHTNFVRAFNAQLNEVEASEGPAALITTSANEKFFSNGLDIDWRRSDADGEGGDKSVFAKEFMTLMARLITFPVPTICAINGHGFGAGFMLALCHDVRLMRADRGYLCANEIEIGFSIPDAELALFRHKMSASAFFDTVQLAHRWTGPAAHAAGFVNAVGSEEDLLSMARNRAEKLAPLGVDRALYAQSKERIFVEHPSINKLNGPAHQLLNAFKH